MAMLYRIKLLFLSLIWLFAFVCAGDSVCGQADRIGQENGERLLAEGKQAFERANYPAAQAKYEEALKSFERMNDRQGIAETAYHLGRVYSRLSQYRKALESLERALKTYGEVGYKKGVADTLRSLGETYRLTAQYSQAMDYAERSLKLGEEIGDKAGVAASMNNMGLVHGALGRYAEALEYHQRSLKMQEEIGDKSGRATSLQSLGIVHDLLGRYAEALSYLRRAFQIRESLGDRWGMAASLNSLGIVSGNLGQYARALEYYHQSLRTRETMDDKSGVAATLSNLGIVYRSLGLYAEALKYYRRSLTLREAIGEPWGVSASLNNIGNTHSLMGDYTRALEYYQKSLKIRETIGDKRGLAEILNGIGVIQKNRGHYAEALPYLQRARQIREEMGDTYGVAVGWLNIGLAHYMKRDMPEAQRHLAEALRLAKEMASPELLLPALHTQGLVFRDTGQPEEAIGLIKEAVQVIENVRGQLPLAEEKASFLRDRLDVYESLIGLLIRSKNYPEAFAYAERAKARAFLDRLAEAKIDPEQGLDPDVRERKRALQLRLADAQKKWRRAHEKQPPDKELVRRLEKELADLDEEDTNLRTEIRRRNPLYADLQYPQPLSLKETQAFLDERSLLLEYVLGSETGHLFAITHDNCQVYSLPAAAPFSQSVTQLRDVLLKPEAVWETTEKSHSRYVQLAGRLYSDLVKPAEALLTGMRRLLVVPDGSLNYLPFELLLKRGQRKMVRIDFTQLSYLVRDYEIHYVPSATVLATLRNSRRDGTNGSQKELVAFADPWYENARSADSRDEARGARSDSSGPPEGDLDPYGMRDVFSQGGERFRRLPNTRLEAEAITRPYPKDKVKVFVGKEASERNVKRLRLDEYKRVHFATHGWIHETKPQLSALVLSLSDVGEEDGYLTMREVFDLRLRADLVVLSACKTGLGQQIRGEGVQSLARAFLYAGTSAVLVSLWSVYDHSTTDLMGRLYRHMEKKGTGKVAALRQAQLEMIGTGRYSHPYYWAPFVLIGSN